MMITHEKNIEISRKIDKAVEEVLEEYKEFNLHGYLTYSFVPAQADSFEFGGVGGAKSLGDGMESYKVVYLLCHLISGSVFSLYSFIDQLDLEPDDKEALIKSSNVLLEYYLNHIFENSSSLIQRYTKEKK